MLNNHLLTILILLYCLPLRLLGFFLSLIRPVKERLVFEKKNFTSLSSLSFKNSKLKADLCFEFSSEGEYQQVAGLIEDALKRNLRLELLFFSPSVEKTMEKLSLLYPEQIRILRYPLLTSSVSFHLLNWVTARKIILVRYDFFPDLYLLAAQKNVSLILLWASFKKERNQGASPSFWKMMFFQKAQTIFFASKADQNFAKKFSLTGQVFDFRMDQIRRRLERRQEKLILALPGFNEYELYLKRYPLNKRVLFGNIWAHDLFLLKDFPQDYCLLIVPHDLSEENLVVIRETLTSLSLSFEENNSSPLMSTRIHLLTLKGILCELYCDFHFTYVGGGFGVSVHSLLEPLISGGKRIACGPVNFRSTEFDLALEYGDLTELKALEDFKLWLRETSLKNNQEKILLSELKQYPSYAEVILKC